MWGSGMFVSLCTSPFFTYHKGWADSWQQFGKLHGKRSTANVSVSQASVSCKKRCVLGLSEPSNGR